MSTNEHKVNTIAYAFGGMLEFSFRSLEIIRCLEGLQLVDDGRKECRRRPQCKAASCEGGRSRALRRTMTATTRRHPSQQHHPSADDDDET